MTGPLWRPSSPCGPWCLQPAGSTRRAPALVVVGRVLATLGMLITAVPVLLVVRGGGRRWSQPPMLARLIARGMLRGLGVRCHTIAPLPAGSALVVANHISWLDVLVILADTPARMLAKQEVRQWPVIGGLAAALDTIFVDRGRPRRLPETVAAVSAALRAGAVVVVFPEGTTWCGARMGRFRPALFQAAIDAAVPVVPVRLGYQLSRSAAAGEPGDPSAGTSLAAFVGAETLWVSWWRVITANGLGVSLQALPGIDARQGSRRHLATAAHTAVDGRVPPVAHPCGRSGGASEQANVVRVGQPA